MEPRSRADEGGTVQGRPVVAPTRRARQTRPLLISALVYALALPPLLSVVAWTATAAAQSQEPVFAWPPGAPRVRLEAVIEPRAGKISRFFRKIAGKPEESLLIRPYGVAWDGDDLLVTDPDAGQLLRLSRRGRVLGSFGGRLASPIGVAVCRDGIVVSDSQAGAVWLLDRALKVAQTLAEKLDRPTGITCDEDEIYVAETGAHRILVLTTEGLRRTLGVRGSAEGELNFPTFLALDGDVLWIGDTLNFRLQGLDAETGAPLASFGGLGDAPGEMPRIKGLAVDGEGHLWVADAHLDLVALFRRDGTFLMELGQTGSGPGELSFPAGIAIRADGRVAVVDSLNRRLQIFSILPPPSEGGGE